MLAIERRNDILEKLQVQKRVIVSELSQCYKVSEETIRRDLEKLEGEGLVIKSYGGAVLKENTNIELPFNVRKNQNVEGKQKIAALLNRIVHDGERLMMDASSTAVFVTKALKEKNNLTVITNSIEIIIELSDKSGWHILSTGGLFKEGSFALVGPQAEHMLNHYHVDKAIVSCKGLDIKAGATDSEEYLAKTKQTMLGLAKQKILAIDHSKFDELAFTSICEMSEFDVVVTDEKPEDKWLEKFKELEIECLY